MFNSVHNKRTTLAESYKTKSEEARKSARRIGNNTFRHVETIDGETFDVVRLHWTDVVKVSKRDGRMILNTGGFRTATTKGRINDHSQRVFYVYSERGAWFVQERKRWNETEKTWEEIQDPFAAGRCVPFFDGITVPDCFDAPEAETRGRKKEAREIARKISALVAPLKTAAAPLPEIGDCLFCQINAGGDGANGKNVGTDCLASHVAERYLHGALCVAAFRWAGWTETRMHYAFHPPGGAFAYWNAAATVRRYLRAHVHALPVLEDGGAE